MSSSSSARKLCFLLLHLAALRYHLGDHQDYLTVSTILTVLLGTALTACNYWLWLCPMDRVRDLSDVGFRHLGSGKLRAAAINRSRRLKKVGRAPPPFPNGWFVLLESRDLSPGQVKQVDALGLNLAVFRGESGQVFVVSAYCVHLGANIAVGGRVKGDCIQCPFHNWKYSGHTGQCVEVPYSASYSTSAIREQAKLPTFTSMERNGLIFLWHHADQEEPSWSPPAIPEIESGDWVYQGRNEFYVNCHIQDIPENGADVAHLDAVHSQSILLGGEPSQSMEEKTEHILKHSWDIQWRVGAEPHTAELTLHHQKVLLDKLGLLSLTVEGLQIGPALVHLSFQSVAGRGVMLQYILPLEENVQKLVHIFYTTRAWIPPYAKIVLLGESILLERDIRVWNSKTYVDKPIILKEDKLIAQHRKWYKQFYSEGSIRSQRQYSLEW